jgi:hypothetical protein
MTERENSPPEIERAAPHHQDDPDQRLDSHTTRQSQGSGPRTFTRSVTPKPLPRICANDIPAQLSARRMAANRSVPLHCGCRDPWVCGHYTTEPPLTDNQLDGWRDAANHVLARGDMPMVPLQVRRALWKRPADRALAKLLHEVCGGVES